MQTTRTIRAAALALATSTALLAPTTWSQGQASSEFLSDYSKLTATSDKYADMRYVAPGVSQKLAKYDAVLIDQPEIFVSEGSKYKGMKPDAAKVLADSMRDALANELRNTYQIATEPGPNVLLIRMAMTDVIMKRKRNVLSFTPAGAVATAVRNAVVDDIMKTTSLVSMSVEGEVLDSTTGEQLAAIVEHRGSDKKDPASWQELQGIMTEYGKRIECRLDNSRMPEAQWADCLAPKQS